MAATGNEVPLLSQLRTLKEWIVENIEAATPGIAQSSKPGLVSAGEEPVSQTGKILLSGVLMVDRDTGEATPKVVLNTLDLMPVGTVLEVKQSASTADPASWFGGTWVMDEDTYLFAGIKRYWRTA